MLKPSLNIVSFYRHLIEQPEIMAVNNDISKYLGSIYGNPVAYDSPNQ